MKKFIMVLAILALSLMLIPFVFAGDAKKGIIKGVDAEKGIIIFSPSGSMERISMQVDKSVDLRNIKAGAKVEITIAGEEDKKIVREIKIIRPRSVEGC